MRHPSMRLVLRPVTVVALLCLALLPWPVRAADKFPEPSLYPVAWELKFTHSIPKRIVVDVPGDRHPQAYWYVTYTVTNETDKPVNFLPNFEMVTDEGKVIRSDRSIPTHVFEAIQRREGNRLLEPARKVEGDVQTGEDQAKDSVAIWVEPMSRMGTFSIFVGGLSGEYITLKKSGEEWVQVDPKNAALELKGLDEKDVTTVRKTLQLTYHVNGDEVRPGEDEVRTKAETWVMR